MEKDQNINSEDQNEEIKETEAKEGIQEQQEDAVEKDQNINSEDQNEEIKETEAKEGIQEQQEDAVEKNQEVKEVTPEEKIKELEDKVARAFAEMENQRRRFEKEKEDAFDYGGFSFAKEALNLIDNLERSKQILESDEVLKDTEALKKTLEHFEIISKDMVSIFSKNGITPVVSIGKKLDPNQHQAMMEIDDDQKEPGTIVQEIQKGFMMKDRLLRPALVGVSKKTKVQNDQKSDENEENSAN
jgi:molecular chaperone GrpE